MLRKSVLTDPGFMADPQLHVEALQRQGPFVRSRLPIIGDIWLATSQEALAAVLKDNEHFSMRRGDGNVTGVQWWMPKAIRLLANNMLTMDEPDHRRLRSLVDVAFRRDAVMALEPRVDAMAHGLATELFSDGQPADLQMRFARALPLAVICEMLGIREADRVRFSQWAERLTTVNGVFGFLAAMPGISKMRRYLADEIARQREEPGEGLIGELVKMQSEGADISDDELTATIFLLLVAGHETTTHVITGGVYELLSRPGQVEWLMAEESRMALAVEELLRVVSAVQFTKPRNVRRDIELLGIRLAKGDVVMPMIVGANYDPAAIDAPEKLDLGRRPNRHVSFGAGIHFCLGHQLARLEVACALRALFTRWPDLALADPGGVRWRARAGIRALDGLMVVPG